MGVVQSCENPYCSGALIFNQFIGKPESERKYHAASKGNKREKCILTRQTTSGLLAASLQKWL
ncbi:hypothetical protein GZ77_23820 [Endozoicomonas montiporae]|uniref:Uncharacterized protein n=1 Tax=Endozoicomonas montiporae TaxID=1027273 RepID=A0A081MZD4_9GAMM|nr:hypothetical protein GZ77_23820 [Endozoicomonas montiporae]